MLHSLQKIKIILASLISAMLVCPNIVSAQWSVSKYSGYNLPSATVTSITSNAMLYLLGIFSTIAVISFVISGILYFVAAGDEKSQERAKRAMTYSIIGVIVGLVGLVVLYAVNNLLKGSTTI